MTTPPAGADLAKVEARIRGLHSNGGRFREALERRLRVLSRKDARQDGAHVVAITGDRRDAEGLAKLLFEEQRATRLEAVIEDDPTSDMVTLVLAGAAP